MDRTVPSLRPRLLLGWQRVAGVFRWAPLALTVCPMMASAVQAQDATPFPGSACRDAVVYEAEARTQRLQEDCVTDETISVANGWTFDGGGHTVYARDPAGGRLQGAVVFIGEGAGDVRDVVIDGSGLEAPCLSDGGATVLGGIAFWNSTGEVRRASVRNLARAFPIDQAQAADGESQLKSCGTGIAVVGESTATVAASTVSDVGYVGVLVESGSATITSSVIVRTEDTGILALRGAQLEMKPGNQVRYGGVGIQFEGAGTEGTIDGSAVAHMKIAGVVSMADGRVSLVDSTIEEIRGPGAIAVGGGAITAERTEINKVQRAFVADGGSLEIQEAAVTDCASGVLSLNGGSSDARGGTLQACDIGLAASGPGSRLSASSVTITGSDRAGVMLEGSAEASLKQLRITQSGAGIAATDHNLLDIEDLHIQDTADVGISVGGGSQVTLTSSDMRSPGSFGVIVGGAGTVLVSTGNSITGAGQTGIQLLEGGRLEASDTHIYGGETGIAAGGIGTTAQLTETHVSATETNLLVTDGALVDASQLVAAGGTTGINISGEGARATVQESTVNLPTGDGIRVLAGGWVSVTSSTITDATGSAVSLQRGADLPTAVELILDENGCTPRVVTVPAGVRTEITFRNAGQSQGQIDSNIGMAFDLAPGATEVIGLMSAPVDTSLRCILPGGNGAWEEVLLRAVPPDQVPLPVAPAEPLVLSGNTIQDGSQGIVVADGVSAIITGNSIEGVTGEALSFAEGAVIDAQDNVIGAATPAPTGVD